MQKRNSRFTLSLICSLIIAQSSITIQAQNSLLYTSIQKTLCFIKNHKNTTSCVLALCALYQARKHFPLNEHRAIKCYEQIPNDSSQGHQTTQELPKRAVLYATGFANDFNSFDTGVLSKESFLDLPFYQVLYHFHQQENAKYRSLAQDCEIDQIHRALCAILKAHPEYQEIVGCGWSMGASSWINYFAKYGKTKEAQKVKHLYLFSPFDTARSALAHIARCSVLPERLSFLATPLSHIANWTIIPFVLARHYCPWGYQPISSLKYIPKDVHIHIFHSDDDDQTNPAGSTAIVERLMQLGHKQINYHHYPNYYGHGCFEHPKVLPVIKHRFHLDTMPVAVK